MMNKNMCIYYGDIKGMIACEVCSKHMDKYILMIIDFGEICENLKTENMCKCHGCRRDLTTKLMQWLYMFQKKTNLCAFSWDMLYSVSIDNVSVFMDLWHIKLYPCELLRWHWGNHMIAPVPVK